MKESVQITRQDAQRSIPFAQMRGGADEGRWITTENGHKVHINAEGEPDKGNPRVIDKMKQNGQHKPSGSRKLSGQQARESLQKVADSFGHSYDPKKKCYDTKTFERDLSSSLEQIESGSEITIEHKTPIDDDFCRTTIIKESDTECTVITPNGNQFKATTAQAARHASSVFGDGSKPTDADPERIGISVKQRKAPAHVRESANKRFSDAMYYLKKTPGGDVSTGQFNRKIAKVFQDLPVGTKVRDGDGNVLVKKSNSMVEYTSKNGRHKETLKSSEVGHFYTEAAQFSEFDPKIAKFTVE